jgi:PncC family amidohydrolase
MNYDKQIIDRLGRELIERGETISAAESVTSGHVQAALSLAENASMFFQGGMTAYNLGQKCLHLHIEPISAESCNCVAEKIAASMALNVCTRFISDYGIGITGYAAPVPEMNINSLFAYYAVAYKGRILLSGKIDCPEQDALKAQIYYTNEVLSELLKACNR